MENDIKHSYDYNELSIKYEWFNSIFGKIMREEGWGIYNCIFKESKYMASTILIVAPLVFKWYDEKPFNSGLSAQTIYNLAKQYGWIVDDDGIVIDYDIDKLIRNRHLLTGIELGLI